MNKDVKTNPSTYPKREGLKNARFAFFGAALLLCLSLAGLWYSQVRFLENLPLEDIQVEGLNWLEEDAFFLEVGLALGQPMKSLSLEALFKRMEAVPLVKGVRGQKGFQKLRLEVEERKPLALGYTSLGELFLLGEEGLVLRRLNQGVLENWKVQEEDKWRLPLVWLQGLPARAELTELGHALGVLSQLEEEKPLLVDAKKFFQVKVQRQRNPRILLFSRQNLTQELQTFLSWEKRIESHLFSGKGLDVRALDKENGGRMVLFPLSQEDFFF